METSQDHWITSIILEHACKKEFKGVLENVLEDKNLVSKVLQNSYGSPEFKRPAKLRVKPVFMLTYLLKKLHSLESFSKISKNSSEINVLPMIIDLLETTYKQFDFTSLKRFFTLISELKLLDLLNLIVENSESSHVIQKLNQHFPRWTATYRTAMEKNFLIENPKVLDKVEESHTQCRRLILKLAVDKPYKSKYMSDQYSNDMDRLMKESKIYIMEAIAALESAAGSSVLEKMVNGEEMESCYSNDLSVQLLLDYIQPEITDEGLLEFLGDHEPILNSQQPTTGLSSCLLPIDTMSEDENCEDSEQSESDYESSQDVNEPVISLVDGLPSVVPSSTSNVLMDQDKGD